MSDSFLFLIRGLSVTLQVVAGAAVVALLAAAMAGLAAQSPLRRLRWAARVYIECFRGTSALVQLYWAFYVLPLLLGVHLSALSVGIGVLGLHIGAYGAEVVRGAIAAVPRGQMEAGVALGLSPLQRLWRVALPQAVPAMVPLGGNLLIELLKVSALVTFITLHDVMWAAGVLRGRQPEAGLAIYLEVMLLFGGVALVLGMLIRQLERPRVLRAVSRGCWWVGEVLGDSARNLKRQVLTGMPRWAEVPAFQRPPAWLGRCWARTGSCPYVQGGFGGLLLLGGGLWLLGPVAERWDGAFTAAVVWPALWRGLQITVLATLIASMLALLLGLGVALLRPVRWIGAPTFWLFEAVRCTPLLVQLFLVFYGVLPALGLRIDPLWVGSVLLGVHYSAYTAEVYRTGIAGVARGQWEAARALGLGRWRTMIRVVLPQAVPRVVPALGNYVVAMFKETPLLSTITVVELLAQAERVQSEHFRGLEAITLVGLLFLALSLLAAVLIRQTERWFPVRHA